MHMQQSGYSIQVLQLLLDWPSGALTLLLHQLNHEQFVFCLQQCGSQVAVSGARGLGGQAGERQWYVRPLAAAAPPQAPAKPPLSGAPLLPSEHHLHRALQAPALSAVAAGASGAPPSTAPSANTACTLEFVGFSALTKVSPGARGAREAANAGHTSAPRSRAPSTERSITSAS